ncbi:hypothetical protein B7463_g8011, partial [Scytalidium lignicola]
MRMAVGNFPLGGKIVIVTGGGSGINLAFVKLVLEKGARVVVADLSLSDEARGFISTSNKEGEVVVFQRCDVSNWGELESLIPFAEKQFGLVPDVYIAGAGVFEPVNIISQTCPPFADKNLEPHFWTNTEKSGYKVVDINLNHPIKLTRLALEALAKKQQKGVVLVVGSMTAFSPQYSSPLYCATKAGVTLFVRSMEDADEREGVKVVLICPGIVETPLWKDRPDVRSGLTGEGFITPEHVARSMVDLIEDGNYGGGTVLEVSSNELPRVLPVWDITPPEISWIPGPEEIDRMNSITPDNSEETQRGPMNWVIL